MFETLQLSAWVVRFTSSFITRLRQLGALTDRLRLLSFFPLIIQIYPVLTLTITTPVAPSTIHEACLGLLLSESYILGLSSLALIEALLGIGQRDQHFQVRIIGTASVHGHKLSIDGLNVEGTSTLLF